MKNVSLNKKGFTLVELLAVIVILALLIVITANTVLPMMNKSKQNGMVVYAERVLSNAAANYQADSITGGSTGSKYYSIETLMQQKDYFGCVKVTGGDQYTYSLIMYDANNKMKIEGYSKDGKISTAASTVAVDWVAADNNPVATAYDNLDASNVVTDECGVGSLKSKLDSYNSGTTAAANVLS